MGTPRCTARRGAALLCPTVVLTASLSALTATPASAQEPVVSPPVQAAVDAPLAAPQDGTHAQERLSAQEPTPAQDAPGAAAAAPVEPPPAAAPDDAVQPEPPVEPPSNRPPVVVDDRLVLVPGGTVSLDLLANDHDPDGDALSLVGGTSAGHGTVDFAGGTVTFTADADFVGDDSFAYVAGDGHGGASPGIVHVTVLRAPEAAPAAKPWNVRPAAPQVAPAPVEAARAAAPEAVAPAVARPVVSRRGAAAPARVPARPAPAAAAPMGPSTTPYVAPVARPATLPFTGGPTDVLLPLGAGLVLAGGLLTATGRRRA